MEELDEPVGSRNRSGCVAQIGRKSADTMVELVVRLLLETFRISASRLFP